MTILLAVSSFKNYIDSVKLNSYLKKKLKLNRDIKIFPMADGGENTSLAIKHYKRCRKIKLKTFDIFKKKIFTEAIVFKKDSIFLDTSDVLGSRNYDIRKINPLKITTYGLGHSLKKLSRKYKYIYIGMGGTVTADGGAGAIEALEGKFYDKNDNEITNINIEKISKIKKILKSKILSKNKLFFLMDAKTVFKDFDIPLNNKIGSKFNKDKKNIKNLIKKNIKYYFSLVSKKNINSILYSINAGAIWLSFFDDKNTKALNGAEFIANMSGIKKFNEKENVLIVGEGKFDNSLLGKGPVYLCKLLNKIKRNYFMVGNLNNQKIKLKKENIFYNSIKLAKNYNINNIFILKKTKLNYTNILGQLKDFSEKFTKHINL